MHPGVVGEGHKDEREQRELDLKKAEKQRSHRPSVMQEQQTLFFGIITGESKDVESFSLIVGYEGIKWGQNRMVIHTLCLVLA